RTRLRHWHLRLDLRPQRDAEPARAGHSVESTSAQLRRGLHAGARPTAARSKDYPGPPAQRPERPPDPAQRRDGVHSARTAAYADDRLVERDVTTSIAC